MKFSLNQILASLLFSTGIFYMSCTSEREKFEYFPKGEVKSRFIYTLDTLNGVKETYYLNGILSSRTSYKNGRKTGPFEIFYRSGALQFSGTYKNDLQFGHIFEYYDSNDSKIKSDGYVVIGDNHDFLYSFEEYDTNGNLINELRELDLATSVNENGSVQFAVKYLSDIEYDSMKIITGPFLHNFLAEDLAKFDTISFVKENVMLHFNSKPDTLRLKFLGFKSYYTENDTLITDVHIKFIEEWIVK